jgi:hypothetical protein
VILRGAVLVLGWFKTAEEVTIIVFTYYQDVNPYDEWKNNPIAYVRLQHFVLK